MNEGLEGGGAVRREQGKQSVEQCCQIGLLFFLSSFLWMDRAFLRGAGLVPRGAVPPPAPP